MYMYVREPIKAARLISVWKQVTVQLISDGPTYLEIPRPPS